MMKKAFLGFAAGIATVSAANAADLASRVPPAPVVAAPVLDWNRSFVGLNAGVQFDGSNNLFLTTIPVGDVGGVAATSAPALTGLVPIQRRTSFAGGGQFGTNFQFGRFVVGTDGDFQIFARGDSFDNANGFASLAAVGGAFATTTTSVSRRVSHLSTERVRAGFLVVPSVLIYGTGGLAYGGVRSQTNIAGALVGGGAAFPFASFGRLSTTRVGYSAGGGVEWMFAPNWSVKGEYLYYDLGRANYTTNTVIPIGAGVSVGTATQTSVRFNGHIARAGINYHFNVANLFGGVFGAPPATR